MARSEWFDIKPVGSGITMLRELHVRMYLVEGKRDVAVIDTGFGIGDLPGLVKTITDAEPIVLQTHAHPDHTGNSHRFDRVHVSPREADDLRRGLPHERYQVMIERITSDVDLPAGFDAATASIPGKEPTGFLNHAETIDLGDRVLEVYETSGHSPGGISFLDRTGRALFVGDAIGPDILLCLPHSDPDRYRLSLDTLVELVDHVEQIYSGHGEPMTPDQVRGVRNGFMDVWSGRTPDGQEERNFGIPVTASVYDFGAFRFLIDPDKLGAARRAQST